MKELIEKVFAVFALTVFVAMLCNHGAIDFTLWDKVVAMTKDAVNSEQGQELIEETKETAYDTATLFIGKAKQSVKDNQEEIESGNKDADDKDSGEKETEKQDTIYKSPEETSDKEEDDTPDAQSLPDTLVKADLVRVVDGDTLVVKANGNDEEVKVRLIGVDTPESVNPDESKNTEYGEKASEYTKSLLKDVDTVYLDFDTEPTDQYGRLLCYVWLKEVDDKSDAYNASNYMLNGILVSNGMAIDKVFEPNIAYADMFAMFREDAKANKAGLWQYEDAF